jgi:hypothetical protein
VARIVGTVTTVPAAASLAVSNSSVGGGAVSVEICPDALA